MTESTVYVVDDDEAIRKSLGMLLTSVGLPARLFDSAQAFLDDFEPNLRGCIVLDIRMPGMSGMELQEELNRIGNTLPIIFITGHGDVPMAVEAMHKHAFDFIQKPFRDQDLIDRINQALSMEASQHDDSSETRDIQQRYETLTNREREVMECVVKGLANKVIALDLDLSQRTIEIHRSRVMQKMKARSLAELVRMSIRLEKPAA